MKTLSELLYKVPIIAVEGNVHVPISNLTFDSRKVETGDAFVAIIGTQNDGHNYIPEVIDKGADRSYSRKYAQKTP